MDTKNRWFFILVAVAIVVSIGATYWRMFVSRNYTIAFETTCDPASEQCFVRTCTPDDPENNPCLDANAPREYYLDISLRAHVVPACDEANAHCTHFTCAGLAERDCHITTCEESLSEGTLSEEVTCSTPESYQQTLLEESIPPAESADVPTEETSETL